jgi:disulfide bond formation protein DsbB
MMDRTTARVATALIGAVLVVMSVAGCGGQASPTTTDPGAVGPGDPVAGAPIYSGTCAPCHGMALQGIGGLGAQLLPNEYVATTNEADLAAFLAVGLAADDPANTQGIAMPPRGGNPTLSDQDLRNVAAYIKAQQ